MMHHHLIQSGAFGPDSLGGPSRIATFTLPLAVKRRKCRWLLSGSVVLLFADINRFMSATNRYCKL